MSYYCETLPATEGFPLSSADAQLKETLTSARGFRSIALPIYRLEDEIVVGYEMLTRGPKGPLEMPDAIFAKSIEHRLLTQVDLSCLRLCIEAAKTFSQE